jgi:hypothetical protein
MATRISGGSFGQAETISAISKPRLPALCGAGGGEADFPLAHSFLEPAASAGAFWGSSPQAFCFAWHGHALLIHLTSDLPDLSVSYV